MSWTFGFATSRKWKLQNGVWLKWIHSLVISTVAISQLKSVNPDKALVSINDGALDQTVIYIDSKNTH